MMILSMYAILTLCIYLVNLKRQLVGAVETDKLSNYSYTVSK